MSGNDRIGPVLTVFGHVFDMVNGCPVRRVTYLDLSDKGDYGHDPILTDTGEPTGLVKMVPSGRVVTVEELRKIRGR